MSDKFSRKLVKNYGKDNVVEQASDFTDSARVRPEDFPYEEKFHLREESHGKSAFTGHGASTNHRRMKDDVMPKSAPAAPSPPKATPNPALDVEVLAPEQQVVGR